MPRVKTGIDKTREKSFCPVAYKLNRAELCSHEGRKFNWWVWRTVPKVVGVPSWFNRREKFLPCSIKISRAQSEFYSHKGRNLNWWVWRIEPKYLLEKNHFYRLRKVQDRLHQLIELYQFVIFNRSQIL